MLITPMHYYSFIILCISTFLVMSAVVHSYAYFASVGLKEKLPDWIEEVLDKNNKKSNDHKIVGDRLWDNFNLLNTLSYLLQIGKKHLKFANHTRDVVGHTLLEYMPSPVPPLPTMNSPGPVRLGDFTEGDTDTLYFIPNREMFENLPQEFETLLQVLYSTSWQ